MPFGRPLLLSVDVVPEFPVVMRVHECQVPPLGGSRSQSLTVGWNRQPRAGRLVDEHKSAMVRSQRQLRYYVTVSSRPSADLEHDTIGGRLPHG